jgi:hypothetical protein
MCVVAILCDVAFKAEAVGALQNGYLSSHPEGAAQTGISVF